MFVSTAENQISENRSNQAVFPLDSV